MAGVYTHYNGDVMVDDRSNVNLSVQSILTSSIHVIMYRKCPIRAVSIWISRLFRLRIWQTTDSVLAT